MMLHDIEGTFDNHYEERTCRPTDPVLSFSGSTLLMSRRDDCVTLPTVAELGTEPQSLIYLFSIDEVRYFLAKEPLSQVDPATSALQGKRGIDAGQTEGIRGADSQYNYQPIDNFRWMQPRSTRFAVEVGWQLFHWYADNRYCGRCGRPTTLNHAERMISCPNCGNTIYPKICPGIIVGIINGDKLLLSRYAGWPEGSWALIAGFTEIGEPLEDTVRREVMEEVGLRVKNITYYTNQPWMPSASLLVGFFAELDGEDAVTVDHSELATAEWVPWNQVPHEPDDYSMTRQMMLEFYRNHDHIDHLIKR
ncbi:MAG: NAD(+) diphosphatase [Eggerthellaceae bacterium]|jgi:NAD+ diphosphatase